ncbi:MAG: rpoB [Verrucomicrobiaceae bacterium]|nr:rpoB [Verrucomicrobiaceae bacterium]
MPLVNPEAALVQNLDDQDPDGRSFDEHAGVHAGALRSRHAGEVVAIDPDRIVVRDAEGKEQEHQTYNNFSFNRKSVTGDTVVIIRRGANTWRGPISEYGWQPGDKAQSIDPVTFEAAWQEVTGYLRHKNDKRLFRVLYASGRAVNVTEDHSLITLSEAGELGPVLPADCVPGKTRSPVVFIPERADDKFARYARSVKSTIMYKWGAIAGMYLAAGCVSKTQTGLVQIAVKPASRIADLQRLFAALLPEVSINDSVKNITFTSFPIGEWLVALFGSGANHKFIAPRVFDMPCDFRLGLVNGYMADDGNLWHDTNGAVQVTGVSTSIKLRDGLVDILASLGVFCTVFDVPVNHLNPNWHDAWGFRISSGHLHKLPICFFYTERQQKLDRLKSDNYRASPYDGVPFPKVFSREAYKGLHGSALKIMYQGAFKGYVSKHCVKHLANPLGAMGRASTMWDIVESITEIPHEEWVFDLEIAGVEMFAVNNGLVVHNSAIHNTAVVKPGDTVKAGQLLAHSNYTDKDGTLAMGLNARIALIPFKGWSMDDAQVISDSFARRLLSEATSTYAQDFDDDIKGGKHHFQSLFPDRFIKEQLANLDEHGVAKPGTVLQPGDPFILAVFSRGHTKACDAIRTTPTAVLPLVLPSSHPAQIPGFIKECAKRDSNPRPTRCKRAALPLSYPRVSAAMPIVRGSGAMARAICKTMNDRGHLRIAVCHSGRKAHFLDNHGKFL